MPIVPHTIGDTGTGGFVALDIVTDGDGVGGRASKVRAGIDARTVTAGEQRTLAHLGQWCHMEDIPSARVGIRSGVAAFGGGHIRHGRALLSGSLLLKDFVRPRRRGRAVRSPKGPRGLGGFSPRYGSSMYIATISSNKQNAKGTHVCILHRLSALT